MHRTLIHNKALIAIAALLAAFMLVSGCTGKRPVPTTPDAVPGHPAREATADQAEKAWEAGDHVRSEVLNRQLLDRGDLSRTDQAKAWERLAISAVKNGHGRVALEALKELGTLSPSAADTWQWHDTYLRALLLIDRSDLARKHLASLLRDTNRPWDVRFRAGLSLARDLWSDQDFEQAMTTLKRLYASSPHPAPVSRGRLEQAFLAELTQTPSDILDRLAGLVPAESQWAFPYTVVRLEQARRYGKQETSRPQAWQLLSNLSRFGLFADENIVKRVAQEMHEKYGAPSGGIALALPMTGPYAEIGWKILRGAGAAQWEAMSAGAHLDIRTINTEAPNWLERLQELPKGYNLVGGPLRTSRFKAMLDAGLTEQRPVFAFSPRLPGAVEGIDAWRFFPSSNDEARALVNLASGKLGITDFGILAPQEPYGERFSEVFAAEVDEWLGSVNATGSYPPKQPTKWGRHVAQFLDVDLSVAEEDREMPEPPFQAVFLPDSWSQAKILVPQLFFYDEDRLLVLGPALWDQGMARDKNIESHYFRLSAFPAPWWPENPAPGTRSLTTALEADGLGKPDFWVALGYDFIRFSSLMPPLPGAWTAENINDAIASAQVMDWSMAPLSWNESGKARQDMFLFAPTSKGAVPLNVDRLAARMERVRERHAQRVEYRKEKRELDKLKQMLEKHPDDMDINMRLQRLKERIEQRKAGAQEGQ